MSISKKPPSFSPLPGEHEGAPNIKYLLSLPNVYSPRRAAGESCRLRQFGCSAAGFIINAPAFVRQSRDFGSAG